MSDLTPDARSILDAGRDGDEPTAADRARVRGALMRAIAAGGAAAAGASAGQAAAAGSAGAKVTAGLALKITAAIALGAAALGGAFVAAAPSPPPAASASQPVAAPPSASPIDTAPPPIASSIDTTPPPAPSSVEDNGPPSAAPSTPAPLAPPPTARRAAPPSSAAASAAPAEDPLEAETRRLREAHGALKGGDPARALALLDEQSAAYQKGQLREERAAARVLALCKLGRVEEAKVAAAGFLRDSPSSPLADRVRASCASSR